MNNLSPLFAIHTKEPVLHEHKDCYHPTGNYTVLKLSTEKHEFLHLFMPFGSRMLDARFKALQHAARRAIEELEESSITITVAGGIHISLRDYLEDACGGR